MLYGAYVAGLILTYISKPPISTSPSPYDDAYTAEILESWQHELSFEESFTRMVGPLQNYLLLPLFFASIGFAIVSCLLSLPTSSALMVDLQPFLDLWQPTVLWKGILPSGPKGGSISSSSVPALDAAGLSSLGDEVDEEDDDGSDEEGIAAGCI